MGQDRWGESDFGQRFGYSDDCLQLSNSNRNRASLVVVAFDLLDLFSKADEVAAQKLGSLGRESRCTSSIGIDGWMSIAVDVMCVLQGCVDLRLAERNVSLHLVNVDLPNGFLFVLTVHMNVHNMSCDGLSIWRSDGYMALAVLGNLPYRASRYVRP